MACTTNHKLTLSKKATQKILTTVDSGSAMESKETASVGSVGGGGAAAVGMAVCLMHIHGTALR